MNAVNTGAGADQTVQVVAVDDTTVLGIAGGVGIALAGTGVGIGLNIGVLTKDTPAARRRL